MYLLARLGPLFAIWSPWKPPYFILTLTLFPSCHIYFHRLCKVWCFGARFRKVSLWSFVPQTLSEDGRKSHDRGGPSATIFIRRLFFKQVVGWRNWSKGNCRGKSPTYQLLTRCNWPLVLFLCDVPSVANQQFAWNPTHRWRTLDYLIKGVKTNFYFYLIFHLYAKDYLLFQRS